MTTTKAAHTAGPWTAINWMVFAGEDPVAEVQGKEYRTDAQIAVQSANARLIAAAPELLAALEKCAAEFLRLGNSMSAKGQGYTVGGLIEREARAAIAKATGAA